MKIRLFRTLLLYILLFLVGCGGSNGSNIVDAGDGGDGAVENEKPIAVIDDIDPINEGTSAVSLMGESSLDNDGTVVSYQWAVEDNAGLSEVVINNGDESQATLILPLSISQDTTVTVSLVVTDNEGLQSTKVTKEITLLNDTSTVLINTGSFDGVWFSPCINNPFGFTSARQKITISGTSLISDITSYTAGTDLARNCTLPTTGGIIVDSDVTTTLSFGSTVMQSGCVGGSGIDTTITLTRFQSSGGDVNTQPDLNGGVELVTGSRDDFLPDLSVVCLKSNGNLLFAGHEYTGSPNNTIINLPPVVTSPNADVTWQVGTNNYSGGASGSASASTSIGGSSVDNIGVVTVSTASLEQLNGEFSGSDLSLSYSLQGAGTYSLGAATDLVSDISSKRMTLRVLVGGIVTPGSATTYGATSGAVAVTVDNNGKYHFTITSPITVSKIISVGNGVPNAPATMSFTMNNIYDYSN